MSETHCMEQSELFLTQQVYQILAGYPDDNDAQLLRNDPLLKSIVGKDPRREDEPLASRSTIHLSNACVNTGPTSRFLFVVTRV